MVLRSDEYRGALREQASIPGAGDDVALAQQLDDLKRWADDLRVALIVQLQRFVCLLDQIDHCNRELAAASDGARRAAADQPAD
ncbi:MAG TPA: hypothetical protein VFW96_01125 [Thermomicrobiales bacterium]|nr:hypothetical protein [Thermomicrobiales bacterium]